VGEGGLRERKKAKTRRAIQEHALRLFAGQGYDATTVEQIAAAAEISPSTFFRYFPTKEDVVVQDHYDPLMMREFLAQPAGLSPVRALREALRIVFGQLYEQDRAELLVRTRLQLEVPAIRARVMASQVSTTNALAEAAAQRYRRDINDLEIQVFAGATIGALFPAAARWIALDGNGSLPGLIDECLACLEDGLRL
jgi:AcrR family transcriptional regulator